MEEIDVTFSAGGAHPIPLPQSTGTFNVQTSFRKLYGWSLREASAATAAEQEGTVVAPGAGAAIATVVAPGAGTYDVTWTVSLVGAAAAADANNFELLVGATVIQVSLNPGAAGVYPQGTVRVTVPAATNISVNAVGAGTAGVTYGASIQATPDPLIGFTAELLDGQVICGESAADFQERDTVFFPHPGVDLQGTLSVQVVTGVVRGCIYLGD